MTYSQHGYVFRSVALRGLLGWLVFLSPMAAARAQSPGASGPAASSPVADYLTPESAAVVTLQPEKVLTNPALALLPIEVAEAASEKYLGMKATDIQRLSLIAEPPLGPQLYYAVVARAGQPWVLNAVAPELIGHTRRGQIGDRPALVSGQPLLPSFTLIDRNTMVAGNRGMIEKLITRDRPPAEGIVAQLSAAGAGADLYVAIDLVKLRPLIQFGLMSARSEVPPEFLPLLEIPTLLESIELTVTLDRAAPSKLVAHAGGATNADRVEEVIARAVANGRAKMKEGMAAQLAAYRASDDPVERAMAAYVDRVAADDTELIKPTRVGNSFVVFDTESGAGQQMAPVAIIGFLVALLLPAVQSAREAARRAQSQNNLKQLMLTTLIHQSVTKSLPAHAIYGDDGKPLLSWRVAMLPYIEEAALYDKFHLDEPWNSEHNQKLIPLMPQVFLDPSSATLTTEEGRTHYLGVVGEGFYFRGNAKGRRFRELADGTSNTIALVQVSDERAEVWTKPADWSPTEGKTAAGLGGLHPGVFLAGFADGSVQAVGLNIDIKTLYSLLTTRGGEIVRRPR
ncbi:MAG: DUF1559 domain-containing protein [Planctomycetota bacterium]